MMTLDEAREHIGDAVVYQAAGSTSEPGVIDRVGRKYVMVRYGSDVLGKATDPDFLTLDERTDEPQEGYRYCLECDHLFMTADELLAGHNKILASLGMPAETDADQVHTCPLCIHDF